MTAPASTLHAHVSTVAGRSQVTRPCTVDEARDLTKRINETGTALWQLMLESYERDAWRVLGYASWREYAEAEFNVSHGRAYQLMDQGRVVRALIEAVGGGDVSTTVENAVSERAARDIKPILPEVAEEVRERVAAGEPAAKVVPEVVQQAREITQAQAAADAPDEPEPDTEAELAATRVRLGEALDKLAAVEKADQHRELLAKCAEIMDLKRQRDSLARELRELRQDADRAAKDLKKIRAELGVERNSEIVPALRALRS